MPKTEPMHFSTQTSANGVVERAFTIGAITGLLWTPAGDADRVPLVLLGHGGGQHKRAPGIVARAQRFVAGCGFAAVAIDMPGHGDRPSAARDEQHIGLIHEGRAAGVPLGPIITAYNAELATRAVPDWQATLDALPAAGVGLTGHTGYFGLALGTAVGVRLVAADSRITAAIFGVVPAETLIDAARAVTVPVEFLLQWDDELVDRESGLALFDAFGSSEKTLHANPGGHVDVPRFELDSAARFFTRHLGGASTPA
jgi:pimeloyl-ACP methyl ester carboxylesterase